MIQNIIGVFFGNKNRIKINLDKEIFYTGDEVNTLNNTLTLCNHNQTKPLFIYL